MADLANIDIANLFSGRREEREATDARIGHAIMEHGGFLISNYPDADTVDDRALKMLTFFDLSEAAKRAVASKASCPECETIYRGYLASLAPEDWAHNEIYDIGPEEPFGGPPIEGMSIFSEKNVWPEPEPCPGWKRAMRDYYDHLHAVGMAIMLSAGRFAGFSDRQLKARFREGNSTLRLLNYPVRPRGDRIAGEMPDTCCAGDETLSLATGRHTDAAGISILWQRQPGLQAQGPDGTWRDVPMIRNCLSVHLGTVMEIMTEGKVPATPHRVIDRGGQRQSIGFFLEPGLGAQLAPIEGSAAACDSVTGTYGWHLQERFHNQKRYAHLVPWPEVAT
jgi:isopenicillin N synthase-like dioxygenase